MRDPGPKHYANCRLATGPAVQHHLQRRKNKKRERPSQLSGLACGDISNSCTKVSKERGSQITIVHPLQVADAAGAAAQQVSSFFFGYDSGDVHLFAMVAFTAKSS